MRKRLARLLQSNVIFLGGLGVCCVLLAAGLVLIVARSVILHRLVLPFAVVFLSPDGIIEENTVKLVDDLMGRTGSVAVVLAALLGCYAFVWRCFSSRLPRNRSTTPPPSPSPVSTRELLLLSGVLIIALIPRLHGISRGLSYDEIYTAMHFVEVDSIWKTISTYLVFNNHIAYSVLARASEAVFGRHEWALRLPALLLGLGSLYSLWAFGRRLLGTRPAIAAAFCLALSPAHVEWSQSARGYTGMILFTLISTHLVFALLDRPRPSDALKFVVASAIGIYFHLYAALIVVVQVILVLLLAGRQLVARRSRLVLSSESFRALWLSFAGLAVLSVTCYAPVLPQLIANIVATGHGGFRPFFPIEVVTYLSGAGSAPLGALVFSAAAVGLISLRMSRPREAGYFSLLFLLPVLLVWVSRPFFLFVRFFVYLLPYYVLLAALGFFTIWRSGTRCRHRGASHGFRLACSVLAVCMLSNWAFDSWANIPEGVFRDVAQAMQSNAAQSTAFCALGGGAHLHQYYFEREITVPRTLEEFQEMTDRYPEVRCVYLPWGGGPPVHTVIAEFLRQAATSHEFRGVMLFTYRR